MLEIAGCPIAGFLDEVGEGEAVGKPGKAVAQHFRTQRPLGLNLDRSVDEAQQASRAVALAPGGQWRKLDAEIAGGNAFAVAEFELLGAVFAVEEALHQLRYRPSLQAGFFLRLDAGGAG